MDEDKRKICRYCAQQINATAKVCPYCRQWLSIFSFRNLSIMTGVLYLWMVLLMIGWVALVNRSTNPGIDFAPYRSGISVVESHMCFATNMLNMPFISVVTLITNRTDKEWKTIEFDARFFDKTGTLIDVGHGAYDDILYPKTDGAVRINASGLHPLSDYNSYKIYIGSARDAHAYAEF